ncbi:MAG: hypothetical protein ACYC9Y_10645 [Candidatus Methylomirabilia bacterium]
MANVRTFAVMVFAVGALCFASSQLLAASRGGNRDLERIFKSGDFGEQEAAQIAKAFKVAVDAGVEDRGALALVESGAAGEFAADQVVRILTVAAQLALERLPTEMFVSKVKEGVSKGMEPGRIVQAAESRALKLKQASNLFKQAVLEGISSRDREELLPDIAEALTSGTDQGRIREILLEAVENGDSPGAIRRKLFP